MESYIIFLLTVLASTALLRVASAATEHYIVYIGARSHPDSESVISTNHEILASVAGSLDIAKDVALHHYTKSFRGFSAMLTEEQALKLSESGSVLSVFKSRMNRLHTTHSWKFLGVTSLSEDYPIAASSSSNVVVGVVDGGVWPESESFNDEGLGPIPTRFKGTCVRGENFTAANCNRKIIGARFYYKGFVAEKGPLESFGATFFLSPRDAEGHGTHTASTIAGSIVRDVSLFGMAKGTARGGAPNARLAIYKACWFNLCSDADILAAMDDAINDGVDILSLSLGPNPPQPIYFEDAVSIGAFHAFHKGVFVSCSAGNTFFPYTATNVAPWIATAVASSIDRDFVANIHLGNSSQILKGTALNPLKMKSWHGVIFGSDAAATGVSSSNASFCKNNTLDPTKVNGKIVVCAAEALTDDVRVKAVILQEVGASGLLAIDTIVRKIGGQFVIPAAVIDDQQAQQLQAYISNQTNPVTKISQTKTVLKVKPAPVVTSFSSQGPNYLTPDIIKPDITAPGLNILAAWSPVSTDGTAGRSGLNYNIISGTSVACPHVSGVAAIIKSYHPTWSPAAIKSAIMTTATQMDNKRELIERDPNGIVATPFDFGSGHVHPIAALDPGLVYDFNTTDLITFLCAFGATPAQLKNMTGKLTNCSNTTMPTYNLNYPSIGISNMNGPVSVYRMVTYYGDGPTTYVAKVTSPSGVNVTVVPDNLKFTKNGEKHSFKIEFTPYNTSNGAFVFGSLTWSDGDHDVTSPIGVNVVSL